MYQAVLRLAYGIAALGATCTSALAQDKVSHLELGTTLYGTKLHSDSNKNSWSFGVGIGARFAKTAQFSWASDIALQKYKGNLYDTNSLILKLGIEYNWFAYNGYREQERWSPYIGLGLGGLYAWETRGTLSPFLYTSAGIKFRLNPRSSFQIAYTWHYATSDRLDALGANPQLGQPIGLASSALRHGDALSTLSLSLFWRIGKDNINCN